jgi:hypothetical protein
LLTRSHCCEIEMELPSINIYFGYFKTSIDKIINTSLKYGIRVKNISTNIKGVFGSRNHFIQNKVVHHVFIPQIW